MVNAPQDITKLATNSDINLTDRLLTAKSSNDLKNTSLNDLFNNKELLNLLSVNLIDSIKLLSLGEYWFNVDNAFKDSDEIEKKIKIGGIDFKKIYVLCNGAGVKPQYALNSVLGVTKTPNLAQGGVFYHYGKGNQEDFGRELGAWQDGGLPDIKLDFGVVNMSDNKDISAVRAGLNTTVRIFNVTQYPFSLAYGSIAKYSRSIIEYSSKKNQMLPSVSGNKPLTDRLIGQWYILADIVKA